jgi:D-xylose transport system permease protein
MAKIEKDPVLAPRPELPPEAAEELTKDLTSAAEAAAIEVPPELVAQTLGEYLRAWGTRIRSGESGILPVLVGLVVITVVFQVISPNHTYLTAGNLVNLFQQSAVFMMLAMAEIFVLLLGEIDLSTGFMAGVAGVIAVQLVQPATTNWPWWAAVAAALLGCVLVGFIQGSLITRLRAPSFVITLAGYLILNGVMLYLLLLGPFSGYPSLIGPADGQHLLHNLMWGTIDATLSWIVMAVIVAALGANLWLRDTRRRHSGLVAPPPSLTIIKIGLMAVVGIAVVAICDINRATFGTLAGVPWVIAIVLGILGVWAVLLERTRYGRAVYAIGGNPEAARRAGVSLVRVRTWAFILCSVTAGIAGLLYVSLLDGASNNIPGGQLVLFAVAAAVIGGTSLFGGRGKIMHGVLGGLVIGGIYNGMYLLGLDIKYQLIATGIVLIIAVAIDSLSRRGSASGSVTHA